MGTIALTAPVPVSRRGVLSERREAHRRGALVERAAAAELAPKAEGARARSSKGGVGHSRVAAIAKRLGLRPVEAEGAPTATGLNPVEAAGAPAATVGPGHTPDAEGRGAPQAAEIGARRRAAEAAA